MSGHNFSYFEPCWYKSNKGIFCRVLNSIDWYTSQAAMGRTLTLTNMMHKFDSTSFWTNSLTCSSQRRSPTRDVTEARTSLGKLRGEVGGQPRTFSKRHEVL